MNVVTLIIFLLIVLVIIDIRNQRHKMKGQIIIEREPLLSSDTLAEIDELQRLNNYDLIRKHQIYLRKTMGMDRRRDSGEMNEDFIILDAIRKEFVSRLNEN